MPKKRRSRRSPPKQRSSELSDFKLTEVPNNLLNRVLAFVDVKTLGNFGQVSRFCRDAVLTFVDLPITTWIFLPGALTPANTDRPVYSVLGFPNYYNFNVVDSRHQIMEVGVLIKKVTVWLGINSRLHIAGQFMSRFCLVSGSNRDLMHVCGLLMQTLIKGWSDLEKFEAARFLHSAFSLHGPLATLLSPLYLLGSQERTELLCHNTLRVVFWEEVPKEDRNAWIAYLLDFVKLSSTAAAARLLLLMCVDRAEDKLVWNSNTLTISASLSQAQHRYGPLVAVLNNIGWKHETLNALFNSPTPWMSANVATLLVLGGYEVVYGFLKNLLPYNVAGVLPCASCQQHLLTSFTSIAVVIVKFGLPSNQVFSLYDMMIANSLPEFRDNLQKNVWRHFVSQLAIMKDMYLMDEREWAGEEVQLFHKVISLFGIRLMEAAYEDDPLIPPFANSV